MYWLNYENALRFNCYQLYCTFFLQSVLCILLTFSIYLILLMNPIYINFFSFQIKNVNFPMKSNMFLYLDNVKRRLGIKIHKSRDLPV